MLHECEQKADEAKFCDVLIIQSKKINEFTQNDFAQFFSHIHSVWIEWNWDSTWGCWTEEGEQQQQEGEMRHSSNHVNHGIRNIGRKMRNRFLFITREFNFRHVSEGFEKRNLPSIIQFGGSPLHHMTSIWGIDGVHSRLFNVHSFTKHT